MAGWQHLQMKADEVESYFTEPEMLVGVLHKNNCFIDIDVYDPELATEIADEAKRRFPGCLERVGQYPKTAIVVGLDEVGYKIHNTVTAEVDGVKAQVEIRTLTRQAVAYGRHPETGQLYQWIGKELWETPVDELPRPTQQEMQDFRDWADAKIRDWAGDEEPQQTAQLFNIGMFHTHSDDRATEEQFTEALRHVPASVDYQTWLECLMGIHDFYGGSQQGLEAAQNWSADYAHYNPREVEQKWRSFEVGKGIGYKSVFHVAKQNGADLSAIARMGQQATVTPKIELNIPTGMERAPEVKTDWPTPLIDFDEKALPKRRWVYGTDYIRKYVSVVASAGGVGKTSQAIVEGMSIVTGRPLLGTEVKEQCNVWIVNLEDPREELVMRALAARKHYKIPPENLRGKLFLDGEDTIQITLAAETRDGILKNETLLQAIANKIKENDIGVVIFDPFVSTHLVNENSNASIQAVVAMFRDLARETESSISLVHHVRKGNGEDATVESVRGAGSLIGAARAARVVNRLSDKQAEQLGLSAKEARSIFRVDDGKANLAPPAEAALYRQMIGVQIDNGEWIGVCAPYELPDEWSGMSDDVVNDMLNMIRKGPARDDDSEEYYSIRPQDKSRWVGVVITDYAFAKAEDFKSAAQAKTIIKQWLENGLLEEVEYYSATQRKDRKGVTAVGRVGEQR